MLGSEVHSLVPEIIQRNSSLSTGLYKYVVDRGIQHMKLLIKLHLTRTPMHIPKLRN